MMNKLSIRCRMTLLSVLLLLVCCLGLTVVLNYSANRMADAIEGTVVAPAFVLGAETTYTQSVPAVSSVAARRGFLEKSVLWMAVIVTAGGALTYVVAGRTLRPLRELSAQMKNRTVHNLSETLPAAQSRDEIASLTDSFNEMTEKLNDAFSAQQRFAQSAAHELRTPLTVMKTRLQVFHKKADRTPAEYETLLSGMELQTDRLSALVKELLDLTCQQELEHGETFALSPFLAEIAAELAPVAKEHGVRVQADCAACTVYGSRSLLYRVFYNLIENALKYNRPGGSVQITAAQTDRETTVCVADTGLGIAPEQRELIFEPFYRVEQSRSRRMGGAGLGLSTVRRILEQHGAKISAGENPGGGSIFTVTLPRK